MLIIDSHKKDISLMEEVLCDAGLSAIIHKFDSISKECMKAIDQVQFDLVIVELGTMKGEDFITNDDVFANLAKVCDQCEQVVVCSMSANMEHVHQSFQAGAMFFYKPILHNDWQEFAKMVASYVKTDAPKKKEKEVPIIRYTNDDRPIDPGSNGFKPQQPKKKTSVGGRC